MKKFLIFLTSTIGTGLIVLYLTFLFYLPKAVDLNEYKPLVQQLAKEQAKVDVNFENLHIVTTPHLQAGAKAENISVKLPDGSTLFSANSIEGRISIPHLLLLTVNVPCAEVVSPRINLDIANGEQFKIVRLVEDILNEEKNNPPKVEAKTEDETQKFSFDPSIIKIKVPNAKITDYKAVINDLKTGHKLTLEGDKLVAGYYNGKAAKLKTTAKLLSDNNTNITANIDVVSFLPPIQPADTDDDPAEKIELPFVNPVLIYRDYDFKTNVNAKLKIKQNKEGKFLVKGFANAEDTTLKLSNLQLPKSYVKSRFYGHSADLDTNINLTQNANIKFKGNVGYGENPYANLNLITSKIYFQDMIVFSKALLDSFHVKNNLAALKANGFWAANAQLKTDFKKIKSQGGIVARRGSISDGSAGLVFDKINANLIFSDNMLKISDTGMNVNGRPIKVQGQINTDSYTDINVTSDKLPLAGLYTAFAPSDLKKVFTINSGELSFDANVKGEMTSAIASADAEVENFAMNDRANSLQINNEKLLAGLVSDMKTLNANILNRNFKLTLPPTGSVIANPKLAVSIDEKNVEIKPTDILINSNSKVTLSGAVKDYLKTMQIDLGADGSLNANDLRKFAGRDAEPFIAAQGNLPLKAKVVGNAKKQSIVAQIKSDGQNYLTPVEIQSTLGKSSVLQAKIDYKGDRLNIRDTGLFTGISNFGDDLSANMQGAKGVLTVHGTLARLNTNEPYINIIKITIPEEINGKITAFKNSSLKANGRLTVFGKVASPILKGNFNVTQLSIPEILTAMDSAAIDFSGKNIGLNINNLLLNGSDVNVALKTDINPHPQFTISGLDVTSKSIDLDKIMKVTEELAKYMAPAPAQTSAQNQPADIPVEIKNGSINLKKIKTGEIIATDTTGKISLKDNNFYLQKLNTHAFDGTIDGNIAANLITMALDIKTSGHGLNVEDALLAAAGMKDMLSGTAAFTTDINLSGTTMEEQMKSLKGTVDFAITDGQLGPFGKLENLIIAENIRDSKFFQTALGGVLNSLTTIDSTHFSLLDGHLNFKDGIVTLDPITSKGNVMSIHISGTMDLLSNTADMKVRGKLASVISNLLGPIAQLNPINLVKVTPGLNVVMAQAFSIFCEQVTPEEMAALPVLDKSNDDLATKFQIVLRGDVNKPLKLVKSFKWLALSSDIENAQNFVSTLPDPSIIDDPENATVEAILQAQAAREAQAIEDAKLKNKLIKFFKKK